MKCRWWNKWYHKRLRNIDLKVLFPALVQRAEMKAMTMYSPYTKEYHQVVEGYVNAAFELHKSLPGQEHWRCECYFGSLTLPKF